MTDGGLLIEDVRIRSRYEATVDGVFAGWVEYRRMGLPPHPRLVVVHTEVMREFGGRGIGAAFVRRVIDDARMSGERISPLCPLFAAHFERHPEDRDVLVPGRPAG